MIFNSEATTVLQTCSRDYVASVFVLSKQSRKFFVCDFSFVIQTFWRSLEFSGHTNMSTFHSIGLPEEMNLNVASSFGAKSRNQLKRILQKAKKGQRLSTFIIFSNFYLYFIII